MVVRKGYEELGVEGFYQLHALDYTNPHEKIICRLVRYAEENWDLGNVIIDLCCGSGEVTRCLPGKQIVGVDPYTCPLYEKETGNQAFKLEFKDIVEGKLFLLCQSCDTIICSFALHLCEESMLYSLLWQLSLISRQLVVISPHKRPDCDHKAGWLLKDEYKLERVTMKKYIHS